MFQKWRRFPRVLSNLRSEDGAPPPIFRPSLSFAPHISRAIRSLGISSICSPQKQACPRSRPNPSRLPTKPQISNALYKSRCFRCGRHGHLAGSCSYPARCFLCGDIGHKRASCRKLAKERSTQRPSSALGHGEEVDLEPFRSTGFEPQHRMDSLLLDPDVEICLGKGNLELGSEGLHLELSQASEVISKAPVQVCLTSKGRSFAVDSFKLGKFLGKEYRLEASRKINRRLEIRSVFGKGRKTVASFALIRSAKLWSLVGKGGTFLTSKMSVPKLIAKATYSPEEEILPDNPQLLNEGSTTSSKEYIGAKLDKVTEIALPPAPFNGISSFEIIDDSEDIYNNDEEGSEQHSTFSSMSMDQSSDEAFCSKDEPPLEPSRMVKEVGAKSPNWLSKTVSPVAIRRSPRLNKVLLV